MNDKQLKSGGSVLTKECCNHLMERIVRFVFLGASLRNAALCRTSYFKATSAGFWS